MSDGVWGAVGVLIIYTLLTPVPIMLGQRSTIRFFPLGVEVQVHYPSNDGAQRNYTDW